jgi:hypothetical protein
MRSAGSKTSRGDFTEWLSIASRTLTGSFRGWGEGLGHPRDRSSILEPPGEKVSFKKMKFNFESERGVGFSVLPKARVGRPRDCGETPALQS